MRGDHEKGINPEEFDNDDCGNHDFIACIKL